MAAAFDSDLRLRRGFPLIFALLAAQISESLGVGLGINYGQIADNLPPPSQVSGILRSIGISRVKLYDADPDVLSAFADSGVEFVITVSNQELPGMADSANAQSWIQQHVQPFLPRTRITCINVGNEVFASNDAALISSLIPAMQSLHQALATLGLDDRVNVSTAHSLAILENSFPPSTGSFKQDLGEFIHPLLDFHSQTKSPFLVNAYPFFAYKSNPDSVSLPYVLFQPNSGVVDQNTNLSYDNMLYAQIDAVYSAMEAMGHNDIGVRVSETGWPSMGDSDEVGATPENAALYNGNLMQRIAMNQGTPAKPSVPVDVHVFALFNENLKPGPMSERNYGLFYPDGSPVYKVGVQGNLRSSLLSSSSKPRVMPGLGFMMPLIVSVIYCFLLR